MLKGHVGVHGENTVATICRVSESATSALKALIEGHASEQHEDSDKCSVATWQRAHLNLRIAALEPQTHKRWLNIVYIQARKSMLFCCKDKTRLMKDEIGFFPF